MTAQEYLKEHNINEKTVQQFNITYDENYLNIPIKDENGELLYIKPRNLNYIKDGEEPKYKNPLNSHATLFNYHMVKDSPNILLCEGELDAMRLTQSGIPVTTSTGGASTFLPEWAEYFKGKNVWLCFDNDKAGNVGTRKALAYIPHAKVVTLPEDVKDICEFFYKGHTKKEFAQLLKMAVTKEEWELINIPEDFQLIKDTELTEMEFPEQDWLIKDILYSEGFCFIYGAEGTGKSYIALSIAKAVAIGKNWLDKFEVPKPTNVLILDKENPQSMQQQRSKGLGDISPNLFYLKCPEKFQLADNKGSLSQFAQTLSTIVERENIQLIVIDSFVDLMVGNESSSGDTQLFFNALRELYPHKAFLVLHHENKPSQGLFRNDSQRLRGSSNINAQTFTMFRLETVAKSKTELTLRQTKARNSLKLDKFMIRMDVERNENSDTYVSGFTYMGEVEEQSEDKQEEAEELIKEIITNSGKNQTSRKYLLDCASGAGISQRTIDRVLKDLVSNNIVRKYRVGKELTLSLNDPIVMMDEMDGGLFS
jgi:hypothetical protein